jgi:hypothetical protein
VAAMTMRGRIHVRFTRRISQLPQREAAHNSFFRTAGQYRTNNQEKQKLSRSILQNLSCEKFYNSKLFPIFAANYNGE